MTAIPVGVSLLANAVGQPKVKRFSARIQKLPPHYESVMAPPPSRKVRLVTLIPSVNNEESTMKFAQLSAFAAALMLSSLVMAEGGGDRTFERMMSANDRSMELFVAKEKAAGNPVAASEKKDDTSRDL